jgi:site-specific DNA-methyltransferase (adenine-specific)
MFELKHGDCLDVLRTMADNSIDAIVTDPPYGLSFMGKKWDYDVPDEAVWRECLRVLKPGGHLLAFAGTRTQHRMAVRIEDAGFEIRDMIAWVYGSGFPKSLDVSKAIDKAAGAERELVKRVRPDGKGAGRLCSGFVGGSQSPQLKRDDSPATPAAKEWHGWGTALKPALEPITVARKPIVGTVANNVMTWGTGGVNVDGCRVEAGPDYEAAGFGPRYGHTSGNRAHGDSRPWIAQKIANGVAVKNSEPHTQGRFPANLIHDGSEEVVGLFPQTNSGGFCGTTQQPTNGQSKGKERQRTREDRLPDSGSAARFFYCAKASKADRDEGCKGMELVRTGGMQATADGSMLTSSGNERVTARANHHPTVKPTDLMRYLCRLVTPPNGTVLDPFMGSGSTGKAAILEGFRFIGIEREAEYLEIARARIDHVTKEPNLWQS